MIYQLEEVPESALGMTTDNSFQQTPREVGSAVEGAGGETRIVVSETYETDSDQTLWSPVSNDTSETGSPPMLAVFPPDAQSDFPPDDHDDELHLFDAYDDLENYGEGGDIDRIGSFSRTSGSGPGKSRSPSRSSPRRHSPTPYSPMRQHRSYSGSSVTLEVDLADVSLSPRRRSSGSLSPHRRRSHSYESVAPEDYLEVTVSCSSPREGLCQAKTVLSTAFSVDRDPDDVEMSPDDPGCPQQRDTFSPDNETGTTSPQRSNGDSADSAVSKAIPSGLGYGDARSLNPAHCSRDPADPFSQQPFDVALLTDDSSDDDLSSAGSDKENAMDDMMFPPQASDNVCRSVSGEVNIAAKAFLLHGAPRNMTVSKEHFHDLGEAAKHPNTQAQTFGCAVKSAEDSVPVQPASMDTGSTHSFHQPGVAYSDQPTGNNLSHGESKALASKSSDDQNRPERPSDVSHTAATGTPIPSSYQHHTDAKTCSQCSPPCTCGGVRFRSASQPSSPCCSPLPLTFPHSLGAVLVHPSQRNPYNAELPTPAIILTPHTTYDGLPHCYPDFDDDKVRPEASHRGPAVVPTSRAGVRGDGDQGGYGDVGPEHWNTQCSVSSDGQPTQGRSHFRDDPSRQQHSMHHQNMDHSSGDWGWSDNCHSVLPSQNSVFTRRQQTTASLPDKHPPGSVGGTTTSSSTSLEERDSGASWSGSAFDPVHSETGSSGCRPQGTGASLRAALIGKLRQVVERRLSSSEDHADSG
ncbi:hypothetical protein BaRGS_00007647 [Batillaria attramentaria]|uniref:Uncharacterized protein n=1 Tax=Batillaria attramentaria TaxID=370345 RepID=A0ABD0LQ19_9CAEN